MTHSQRNGVVRERISDLRDELSGFRNQLLEMKWNKSLEEPEMLTVYSQVLDLSDFIMNRVLNDIDWSSSEGFKEANK